MVVKNWLAGLILCVLAGFLYLGYLAYPLVNKPPQIASDTVFIYDTITHFVPDTVPYYIVKTDSVTIKDTVFAEIDTLAILLDYYSLHYYTRTWEDSLLIATSHDAISENEFIDNTFTYKIKYPQQIIYNTTVYSYSKYLYGGVTIPLGNLNYTGIQLSYASPKFTTGLLYQPGIKAVSLSLGGTIKKFK
jgi:hypothetical protein